jgi:NTP pyrophosphatase (non-canonical NTP hydrolase)
MLVVTELAEAAEAVRHGDEANFKEEMADAYIRMLDMTGTFVGFDLEQEIENKMAVNEGRPPLHGKRC